MDRALFEVVQHKLTQQWTMRSRLRNAGGHLLAGVLVDDAAHRMVATDAAKRGVRCRYYVSRPHLAGESRTATLGSVSRLPAAALEEAVTALHDHQAAVRSGCTPIDRGLIVGLLAGSRCGLITSQSGSRSRASMIQRLKPMRRHS